MRECEAMYRQFPVAIEWPDYSGDGVRARAMASRFADWIKGVGLTPNVDYIIHRSRPLRGQRTPLDAIAFKTKAHALQFKLSFQGVV